LSGGASILLPDEIRKRLQTVDPVACMEHAFRAFSRGQAIVPPPGELIFRDPPGDVHIKYGYVTGGDFYVVKIASGFYDNPKHGLPSSNGVMLAFRRQTGELAAILDDRGYLTDVRTAAAGAVAARYLAPPEIDVIGIIGTGIQAEMQAQYLQTVRPCRNLIVWGRREQGASDYAERMRRQDFSVTIASSPEEVAARSRLIVTATPSLEPHLHASMIHPGTHITAMGADTPDKRELHPGVFGIADIIATDSRVQGFKRGDLKGALEACATDPRHVTELGELIDGKAAARTSRDQITIASLTGLGAQDVAIASAVLASGA
jgi:ornithine cyclodeaminase